MVPVPHDCPDTCALLTTVQDGVATAVWQSGPSQYQRCPVCQGLPLYRAHLPPQTGYCIRSKRNGPKGSGQFVRVSWDEALSDIANRLQSIAVRDPQAILPYSYAGTMGLVRGDGMAARFFHKLAPPAEPHHLRHRGTARASHPGRQGGHACVRYFAETS